MIFKANMFFCILMALFGTFLVVNGVEKYGRVRISSPNVVSVRSGDRFEANIPGYPPIVGKQIMVRVRGIMTPKSRNIDLQKQLPAIMATKFTFNKLMYAREIWLVDMGRDDKCFGIVANVLIDGEDLGAALLRAGYACLCYGDNYNWDEYDE